MVKKSYKFRNGYLIITRIKYKFSAPVWTEVIYIKLDDRKYPVYPIAVYQGEFKA